MKPQYAAIKKQLKTLSNEKVAAANQYFFKEPIKTYGVKTPVVNEISKEVIRDLKPASKSDIFKLCDLLFESGYQEEATIAAELSYSRRKEFEPDDFIIFQQWLKLYIDNWATCDKFCNNTIGAMLLLYPEFLAKMKTWAKDKNRWLRRAAAVSLIVPARKGKFTKEIFEIAKILLEDEDDFVRKGYGWMLKETCKHQQKAVFDFVMKHKASMPRLSLRYAIEKFPSDLKILAMAK